MKWGKSDKLTYKRQRKRQALINLRQMWANACQVPSQYLYGAGTNLSVECTNKLREVQKTLRMDYIKLTCKLPRKLKKKLRKSYRSLV